MTAQHMAAVVMLRPPENCIMKTPTAGGGSGDPNPNAGDGADGSHSTFEGNGADIGAGGGAGPESAAGAEAEAVATREQPKGVKAALEAIRTSLDEDAHILWTSPGPRRSHIEEFAGVLVTVDDGIRRIMIVQAFTSGAWRLYSELAGKAGPEQLKALVETTGF